MVWLCSWSILVLEEIQRAARRSIWRQKYTKGKTELKSDIWALGISLIEMAEGKNPFDGCTSAVVMNRVINKEPPTLSSSKWSGEFVDFVSKCLMKDVKERWSVSALMNVHVVMDDDA